MIGRKLDLRNLVLAIAAGAIVLAGGSQAAPGARDAASSLSAGQEFDDCNGATWCPRMVVLPAGSFLMGSPPAEIGRYDDEGPQHEVTIARFAVGKFHVTRGQWAAFVAATNRPDTVGCEWSGNSKSSDATATWRTLGFAQDDTHPVVCISWTDAQDYVRWLSQRTGHTYRLLSEAEWEYAARAGTKTPYPWGANASHDQANFGADQCCSGFASGRDQWVNTSPVGSFPPNAFGLYDVIGNAWQWVQDCYVDSYRAAPPDGSAVQTASCLIKVGRGGSWGDVPPGVRSAIRSFAPPPPETNPNYRSGGFGLRVARVLR